MAKWGDKPRVIQAQSIEVAVIDAMLVALPDRTGIARMWYAHGPSRWMARVYWQKKTYTRSFADHTYGSIAASLTAAVQWRDELKQQLRDEAVR